MYSWCTARLGQPYRLEHWLRQPIKFPRVTGDHDMDIVIIGGAVTGCACAYLFGSRRHGFPHHNAPVLAPRVFRGVPFNA